MVSLFYCAALAVLAGVEAIARCNEVIVIIIIILLIPVFFFAIPDMDITRLSPLLAEGVMPVLKGAVVPSAWMSQVFFLGWFLQHVNEKPQSIRKDMLCGNRRYCCVDHGIDIVTIHDFRSDNCPVEVRFSESHPIYRYHRAVERIEAIAIAIWVLGIFIKVSMLLYMFTIKCSPTVRHEKLSEELLFQ